MMRGRSGQQFRGHLVKAPSGTIVNSFRHSECNGSARYAVASERGDFL